MPSAAGMQPLLSSNPSAWTVRGGHTAAAKVSASGEKMTCACAHATTAHALALKSSLDSIMPWFGSDGSKLDPVDPNQSIRLCESNNSRSSAAA
eukprot:347873-Chlamydomonas_euryale.AAC.2